MEKKCVWNTDIVSMISVAMIKHIFGFHLFFQVLTMALQKHRGLNIMQVETVFRNKVKVADKKPDSSWESKAQTNADWGSYTWQIAAWSKNVNTFRNNIKVAYKKPVSSWGVQGTDWMQIEDHVHDKLQGGPKSVNTFRKKVKSSGQETG